MSVSFMWEIVKPSRAKSFRYGTSSDEVALANTFGNEISLADISTLKAMHRATRLENSLWSDIADTLERVSGDGGTTDTKLRVWTEY
jgi:hypothetical protein